MKLLSEELQKAKKTAASDLSSGSQDSDDIFKGG